MSQIARSVLRRVLRTNQRAISEVVENTLTLPTADRVFYIPNRYDSSSGKFLDRDGKHAGAPQLLQYASLAAPVTLYHASIIGTETATNAGTASVTFSAGSVTIGAGTAWHIVDSVGHVWEFCSALSSTSVVMWDVSGNGHHLIAEGLGEAVVVVLCSTSRDLTIGTDWLDRGFTVSDGNQYLHPVSGGLIPDDVAIPKLETGAGCCAFAVVRG